MGMTETIIEIPAEHERNVFGQFDVYAKKIERSLHVTLIARDENVKIMGDATKVEKAKSVLLKLTELSKRGNTIQEQNVDYTLSLAMEGSEDSVLEIDKEIICHTMQGKPIKPKTLGQKKYVDAIRSKMVVFGLGPAGTGKTYLAMAMAITAFKNNEVGRIILTRPAIEAGEKLGFLPGDLQSKIDPYLRPLYDALYQIMGAESFLRNSEKGLIEVAPLAYMRGRTLDNAFIILDEAQNTTPAQMKMFLTRIGFGSKVVITGDETQKDLLPGQVSGLDTAVNVVKNIEDISICRMTNKDVVRHPLVQKIVKAYEEYENKIAGNGKKRDKRRK
ncbi:PhoH-like protein [Lachnospiraceae bacterium]|jgi:phosphate starvation-inducible PhoH-like protein|nr:PhoH family protein [Dorea sp.]GFI36081.1 PhoH-like protein [Lachnospiraceae bacterium]